MPSLNADPEHRSLAPPGVSGLLGSLLVAGTTRPSAAASGKPET